MFQAFRNRLLTRPFCDLTALPLNSCGGNYTPSDTRTYLGANQGLKHKRPLLILRSSHLCCTVRKLHGPTPRVTWS